MVAGVVADPLPPLRPGLRLVGRRHDPSGAEIGVIYDPVRHRFFELSPLAQIMLAHWHLGQKGMLQAVNALVAFDADETDLVELLQFLMGNELLTLKPSPRQYSFFRRFEQLAGQAFFFRIPLLHPDRLIDEIATLLSPILRPGPVTALLLFALAGLFLVARQWDLFASGFRTVFNLGGAASFILAVAFAKAIHEFGHALAAKRMGCRVPAVGVAVMFGAPLLYTDLSDTWRLERPRDRLLVASGGIIAETVLAALATWGWLILPEGPSRGACFFLATAAWTATLVLNANPFMRFDGYFILSDFLGVPNLQERAFAIGRWALRRLLWGSREECPDESPARLRTVMHVYAWTTWGVRVGIYLGLAYAAFRVLPKAAAVPMLISELWMLVFRPIFHELRHWWQRRAEFLSTRRGRLVGALSAGLLLWLMVPQSFDLALPAVYASQQRQWIYSPHPAILKSYQPDGAHVVAGQVIAELYDPDLDHQVKTSQLRLAMLRAVQTQLETDQRWARDLLVQRQKIAEEEATLSGILAQQRALTLRAPISGYITESAPDLRAGTWRTPSAPLFLVLSEGKSSLTAFVNDRDLAMVKPGGKAQFHPAAAGFPIIAARVVTVGSVPAETLAEPLLASLNGGPIPVERQGVDKLVPQQGEYPVTAIPITPQTALPTPALNGVLLAESQPHSLLWLGVRRVYSVIIRESGM